MEKLIQEKILCYHCGEVCPGDSISIDDKYFCCSGCKAVYEILNESNLCNYYSIESNPGKQPSYHEKKFDYLDDPATVEKIVTFQNESAAYVTFYIPNIHCTSCIWILENLYRLHPGMFHSEVNFVNKTVSIKYHKERISLKDVVKKLSSIGYEPLIQLDVLDRKKNISENKKILYKLGIAGFCFGNIMLLSFPEYLSIGVTETFYRQLFAYLNFILSLPVLFYSASDYFTSAFKSLRERIININFPLSIGIFVLFARSCWEIFTETGAGYFDSMTGLVFLLLIGKYIQQKTYSSLNFERDYKSYFPLSVIKKVNDEEASVPVSELKTGDRILVRNNEIIPGDSILFSDEALIDYSFITGESVPILKKQGEYIYAGGKLKGNITELEIIKEVSQSYLTRLWNNSSFHKTRGKDFTHFTNNISHHFTSITLAIAVISSLLWLPDWYNAINVFTAVLIVACPCALALSVPFTYGNALRILGRNKFYINNSLNIEELNRADTIVFDKTGTITKSESSEVRYLGLPLSEEEKLMIKSLTRNSVHPLSRNLFSSLQGDIVINPSSYTETGGLGIEGEFNKKKIRLGGRHFVNPVLQEEKKIINRTHVHLSINDQYMGYFEFANKYRDGIFEILTELQKNHNLYLLSGDNKGEKPLLQNYFKEENLLFNQTPQAKLEFVKSLQDKGNRVLMIGDGLNDAGALSQSDFGISVTENISNFSPACDAILDSSSLNKIDKFIKFSSDSAKIIYLNFFISLLYNIAGLSFAVSGLLTPLIAAVLMPVSSITVVALAALGTTAAARKRGLQCQ